MVVVVVVIDSLQEIWELSGVVDPFCLRRFERYSALLADRFRSRKILTETSISALDSFLSQATCFSIRLTDIILFFTKFNHQGASDSKG